MALTHSHYLRYRKSGSTYTKYGNTTKQTTPSIAFRAGGKTYYIPLSQATPNASYPIGVRYNNKTYRIGTSSATFTASNVSATGNGVFIMGGFSVSNGGFDQSWTLSAKMYNASKSEITKTADNPQTYSASTTSSSSNFFLCHAGQTFFYIKLFIKVFNTTYSTDYIAVQQNVGTSISLTIT